MAAVRIGISQIIVSVVPLIWPKRSTYVDAKQAIPSVHFTVGSRNRIPLVYADLCSICGENIHGICGENIHGIPLFKSLNDVDPSCSTLQHVFDHCMQKGNILLTRSEPTKGLQWRTGLASHWSCSFMCLLICMCMSFLVVWYCFNCVYFDMSMFCSVNQKFGGLLGRFVVF